MQLHSRIFVLMLLLLLGLGTTSTVFLYQATQSRVEADAAEQLSRAGQSFVDAFENRQKNLLASVQTVVDDWGLRQAIGQRDRSTVESVLFNHSKRVGADIALFVDLDRRVAASTLDAPLQMGSLSDHLPDASAGVRESFVAIGGRCYQLVIAEVRVPLSAGWVGMGFLVDDQLASRFSRLNGVGVSFVRSDRDAPLVIASSLADSGRAMAAAAAASGSEPIGVAAKGWSDLVMHHRLEGDGSDLTVVLQKSLNEPLASFRSWWWSLLMIFSLTVCLALLVAYFFARGMTRPLTMLQHAVEDMESGNYTTSIDVRRADEIGFLAKAFSRMQTAIAEREEEIRYRAEHDLVTKIHNRGGYLAGLDVRLEQARSAGTMQAVLCFSVNHFKQIVDALGHDWGDRLLKMIADRLLKRFPVHCLAHVDSDEFSLVMSTSSLTNLFGLGEQIHACFSDEFVIRGISLSLTVCVGISVSPEHADDPRRLLRRAGVARNAAIEGHRKTVVYDPDLDQNSVRRLTLMSELPNAIRNGQLDLHYQPKIQCSDDGPRVCGVECLVRWNHPELGWIPPDDFIGLAEKTGYIVELTRHVLRRAVHQCRQWRDRGWLISVSVNISALDLEREAFAGEVQTLLAEAGLDAGSLCLEVTESTAMEDPESSIERLTALSELGVRLSIDDYGTGYSSLAQLKKLPVHELKIDKSFVQDLDRSSDDQTIVRSTIELAHNIGLEVIAEGVESQRILWQLDQWGCEYVQGFHISRPLPQQEFETWILETDFAVPGRAETMVVTQLAAPATQG